MGNAFFHLVERKAASVLRRVRIDWWARSIIRPIAGLEWIGSSYGGWVVPAGLLNVDSIVLLAGVGLDATFDLGLITKAGCKVYALDPTPRSAEYARSICDPRFHFQPIGLWDEDAMQRFYVPSNPEHISHSIVNLQQTESWFEAECRTVRSVLRSHGYDRLDLIKVDIEGAEYRVLAQMLSDRILPGILCVEFDELHHPLDRMFRQRIKSLVDRLLDTNYRLVHATSSGNYTFVHLPWLAGRELASQNQV